MTVVSGPNKGQTVEVSGDATAADVSGLAAGGQSFQVQSFDQFGLGVASATSNVYTAPGATSTYASTVIGAKPAVFYRLDDAGSDDMTDSSGNAENGSYFSDSGGLSPPNVTFGTAGPLLNDPSPAVSDSNTTQLDQGVGFGPASDASALPEGNSPFSTELWFQTQLGSTYGNPLVSWGTSPWSGNSQTLFAVAEPSPQTIEVYASGETLSFVTPYLVDDGLWHQLVVTYDGTHVIVYLDGQPIGEQRFQYPADIGAGPVTVGAASGFGWASQETNFADVSVYSSVLTPTDVATHFTMGGYSTPAAPSSPTATAGTNSATVTWGAPPASDPPVSSYVVTAVPTSTGSPANSMSVAGSSTSATLTGLVGGAPNDFEVQAANAYGVGPPGRHLDGCHPDGFGHHLREHSLGGPPGRLLPPG